MKNKKSIDDLVKNELGNYTETPPSSVWDTLEKRLDNMPARSPRPAYKWFGYMAMVAVLALISVFVAKSITGNTHQAANNITLNNNDLSVQKATPGGNTNSPATTASNATTTSQTQGNTTTNNDNPTNSDTKNNTTNNTSPSTNDQTSGDITTGNNQVGKSTGTAKMNDKKHSKTSAIANKHTRHRSTSAGRFAKTKQNKTGKESTQAQSNQNVYSSAPETTTAQSIDNSNTARTEQVTDENAAGQATSKSNTTDSSINKEDTTNNPPNNPPPPPPPTKIKFNRFEAGVKGGYERGFDNDASKKIVASPYLEYKITQKFSIMLQPAIKSATLSSRSIGTPRSYYKANADSLATQNGPSTLIVIPGTDGIDSLYRTTYSYSQSHDSIVKSNKIGGTYMEYELPVLLKYYITKTFSVYGGVSINYSKLNSIKENTYTARNIPINRDDTLFTRPGQSIAPYPVNSVITYHGTPYTSYTGPQYPAPQGSLFRFGYMLGFSYEFNKNWLFDALIQQSPVAPNIQGGYNVNTPLSAPYFRLTIGYKIVK